MAKRLSIVVSQTPSKNPAKRNLEEEIVAGLLLEPGIDVTIVPNLYDIKPDSTGMLALQQINGNVVVCSWLFERAAHWILDRHGIHGHTGQVLLKNEDQDENDDDESDQEPAPEDDKQRVIENRSIPNRKIYCLDLKSNHQASDYIDEVKRISQESSVQLVGLGDIVNRVESSAGRRWYPVIDYSRCTNCMECIDFCLFGVYGVDRIDTILVEQPDNCRKGCPACSRVCPENAIMFPQHKTPAIAGSSDAAASLKIDLSQLFGAPAEGKTAEEIAAIERDEQLVAAGREAVGLTPRRSTENQQPKDDLDDLVDELNELEL